MVYSLLCRVLTVIELLRHVQITARRACLRVEEPVTVSASRSCIVFYLAKRRTKCMCTYIYIHKPDVYAHISMCMHVCIYIYMHIHIYVPIYTYIYMSTSHMHVSISFLQKKRALRCLTHNPEAHPSIPLPISILYPLLRSPLKGT